MPCHLWKNLFEMVFFMIVGLSPVVQTANLYKLLHLLHLSKRSAGKSRMKKIWIGCVATGLMVVSGGLFGDAMAGAAVAGHPPMLSHRAIYNVSLAPGRKHGQVSSVDGRMVTEWQETCDGLISEQRIVTDMRDEAGETSLSDISASSWESRDGLQFRFSMRQRLDHELMAEYDGNASFASALGAGTAMLRKPEEKEVKLPAGVLFPSGYMQSLLDAARGGQKLLTRKVFDGTSQSDYYQVISSIGAGTNRPAGGNAKGASTPKSVLAATSGLMWWPVQVSYYAIDQKEGVPEFEMAFRLYDNGISANLILDYGGFALFASLQRIDAYKPPDC